MSFKGLVSKINEEASPTQRSASLPALPKIAPELAANRAAILFGCYRKADASDPDIYAAAVTAILSEYDEETVAFVTDPRTGLPRSSKWLPTISEIDKACSDHAKFLRQKSWMLAHGWRLVEGRWLKPGEAA